MQLVLSTDGFLPLPISPGETCFRQKVDYHAFYIEHEDLFCQFCSAEFESKSVHSGLLATKVAEVFLLCLDVVVPTRKAQLLTSVV